MIDVIRANEITHDRLAAPATAHHWNTRLRADQVYYGERIYRAENALKLVDCRIVLGTSKCFCTSNAAAFSTSG